MSPWNELEDPASKDGVNVGIAGISSLAIVGVATTLLSCAAGEISKFGGCRLGWHWGASVCLGGVGGIS